MTDIIRDADGREIAPPQADAPPARPQGPWDNNRGRYEHLAPSADQVARLLQRMGGSHGT